MDEHLSGEPNLVADAFELKEYNRQILDYSEHQKKLYDNMDE